METTELLKKVRKIEIKSKNISNQIFSGEYHSAFKGKGMLFSEVREYMYGDDVKNIDWNVTARFNTPFIKVFEEERELTVMLLVDISKSAFFGTQNAMKNEIITEICAILAFSAIQNNDKVGVIFFNNTIEKFIPPKKGKSHVLQIIRHLIEYGYNQNNNTKTANTTLNTTHWWQKIFNNSSNTETSSQTNIQQALQYFNNTIKKRSIAFLLSDFIDNNYDKALALASKKHDLIGIHLYDVAEQKLPNLGIIQVIDAETGYNQWINTKNSTTQNNYAIEFKKNLDYSQQSFSKSGANLISIPINKPYTPYLVNLFKKRS